MNWLERVDGIRARLGRLILPSHCVLCGAAGEAERDLCAGCAADILANSPCCPRCALPLQIAAAQCGECLQRPPPFTAAWAPFRYGAPLDRLETRLKFRGDLAAGRVLAELLIERAKKDRPAFPQAMICVPLHHRRLRQRGYNQAAELALPLCRALGIPLLDALRRVRDTAMQTGLDAAERRRNLRGAFDLREAVTLPAHIALFDDVMTTGSTLRECAAVLRRAGVARVDVWALARAPSPRAG